MRRGASESNGFVSERARRLHVDQRQAVEACESRRSFCTAPARLEVQRRLRYANAEVNLDVDVRRDARPSPPVPVVAHTPTEEQALAPQAVLRLFTRRSAGGGAHDLVVRVTLARLLPRLAERDAGVPGAEEVLTVRPPVLRGAAESEDHAAALVGAIPGSPGVIARTSRAASRRR